MADRTLEVRLIPVGYEDGDMRDIEFVPHARWVTEWERVPLDGPFAQCHTCGVDLRVTMPLFVGPITEWLLEHADHVVGFPHESGKGQD